MLGNSALRFRVLKQIEVHHPNKKTLEATLSFSPKNPPILTIRPKYTQAYSSSSSDDDVRDERSDFSLDLSSSSSSSSSEYTSLVFNGCFLARSSAKKKGEMFTHSLNKKLKHLLSLEKNQDMGRDSIDSPILSGLHSDHRGYRKNRVKPELKTFRRGDWVAQLVE